ncbi:MAG: heavy metal translocating P-type ATPase [Betaproteobacteria bacterium]
MANSSGGVVGTRSLRVGEPVACFHCGLPVQDPQLNFAVVDGAGRSFCCAGCQAVTEAVVGAGLAAFYRSRAVAAPPVPSTPSGDLEIFDRPEVQEEWVEVAPDGSASVTLALEGITCAACAWLNEQHLAAVPGVLRADVNYSTRRARVRWDPARIRLSSILQTIQDIGYRAFPAESAAAEHAERQERRSALWRLFVAGFGMMQVMMYAYPAYIATKGELSPDIAGLLRWASLVIALPVVGYSAAPFFRSALRDLRLRRLGMDVPVALGVAAAFAGSCLATLRGSGEVYFDSVAMFVFFLLAGRWMEQAAREKAGGALRDLARAMPARAARLSRYPASRETEIVPALALRPGDHVLVRPGDAFAADGTVVEGETRVDESLLTGESLPGPRSPGMAVVAGSANVAQPVVMRVERAGAQTRLSGIVRLMETAQRDRPRLTQLADLHSGRFVLAVVMIAAGSAMFWWSTDASKALLTAVAVLVVSCPCALSLATPAAFAVSIGAFARLGLIVTRSSAIEILARATHVVLDKTGTLTEGTLCLLRTHMPGGGDPAAALDVAAALGDGSEHPVSRVLRQGLQRPLLPVEGVHHEPGSGVEGRIGGVLYRMGNRSYVSELCGPVEPDDGGLPVTEAWLGSAGGWIARFEFGDQLRADAPGAVRALKAMGLTVILASGDQPAVVEAVARQCGIGIWEGGCSPERKHALVAGLQQNGSVVCMVGDGVNDAPVIAQANVSVAMGSGAPLAQLAADFVLASGQVSAVAEGVIQARRTTGIVRQNLTWAFVYNLLAIPLAASGLIAPWAAGLGMAGSSALVVANALRLRGSKRTVPVAQGDSLPAVAVVG